MKSYTIQTYLDDIYNKYPEYKKRPIIGITANTQGEDVLVRYPYCEQVIAAGGVPVILSPTNDNDTIVNMLENVDGLVLSGGADANPLW